MPLYDEIEKKVSERAELLSDKKFHEARLIESELGRFNVFLKDFKNGTEWSMGNKK